MSAKSLNTETFTIVAVDAEDANQSQIDEIDQQMHEEHLQQSQDDQELQQTSPPLSPTKLIFINNNNNLKMEEVDDEEEEIELDFSTSEHFEQCRVVSESTTKSSSAVWQYYGVLKRQNQFIDRGHFYCMRCFKEQKIKKYQRSTSTGNLMKHLNKGHDISLTQTFRVKSDRNGIGIKITKHPQKTENCKFDFIPADNQQKAVTTPSIQNDDDNSYDYLVHDINEIIISEVAKRPQLYDSSLLSNRGSKQQYRRALWHEVHDTLNGLITFEKLQKIWKNIRDRYHKIKRDMSKGIVQQTKYRYFDLLKFLDNDDDLDPLNSIGVKRNTRISSVTGGSTNNKRNDIDNILSNCSFIADNSSEIENDLSGVKDEDDNMMYEVIGGGGGGEDDEDDDDGDRYDGDRYDGDRYDGDDDAVGGGGDDDDIDVHEDENYNDNELHITDELIERHNQQKQQQQQEQNKHNINVNNYTNKNAGTGIHYSNSRYKLVRNEQQQHERQIFSKRHSEDNIESNSNNFKKVKIELKSTDKLTKLSPQQQKNIQNQLVQNVDQQQHIQLQGHYQQQEEEQQQQQQELQYAEVLNDSISGIRNESDKVDTRTMEEYDIFGNLIAEVMKNMKKKNCRVLQMKILQLITDLDEDS